MKNEINVKIGGGHGGKSFKAFFKFATRNIQTAKKIQQFSVSSRQKRTDNHKFWA